MDVEAADGIVALLGEVFGRQRGLPQLVAASDLLSDTYLLGIERSLLRTGYEVVRFADDFKVPAEDWGQANEIIELAAGFARDYGLVLSSAKTTIRKANTIRDERARLAAFLQEYFDAARDDLTIVDVFQHEYGEEVFELEPPEVEAHEAAFWRILREWHESGDGSGVPFHSHHLPLALSGVRNSGKRVDDEVLENMTFIKPIHLEAVLKYLTRRPEVAENWRSLKRLAAMPRQSPWAKLWLLDAAESLTSGGGADEMAVFEWVRRQLGERHESVRASAVWLLARRKMVTEGDVQSMAVGATSISRPLLAAAATASEIDSKFMRSVKAHSPLSKEAAEWASRCLG